LTISDVTDDAQHEWPAFAQLLGVVLQYLQDALELSLTHVDVSDCAQLLQWQQQPHLQLLQKQSTASACYQQQQQ